MLSDSFHIDGVGVFNGDSPSHSTNDWLANGAALVMQEIQAQMNRLATQLADALFK
jgi:hypothetical protein